MIKRICDVCGCEVEYYEKTSKTQWFKIIDGLLDNECDICKPCLEKIVEFMRRDNA